VISNEVYALKDGVLHILRNSGLFSNCSISLFCIVGYFNRFHKCPEKVGFSKTFAAYKDDSDSDVYPEYFQFDERITIPWLCNINMNWHSLFDYRQEPYDMLGLFMKKYFSPSDKVLAIAEDFRSKYNIDFDL
jgi:hypothetical protein